MALRGGKSPRHARSPMPVVGFPMGPAHSLAVERLHLSSFTWKQSSKPLREFCYLNQLLLLIRGLEILGVPFPWDCLLPRISPMVEETPQSSPQQGKRRFGDRVQLCVTSFAVRASLGSQHSAPRELCHNCHPLCSQKWDVRAKICPS